MLTSDNDVPVGLPEDNAHRINEDDPDLEIVDWNGHDDPGHPFNWSPRKKWTVTLAVLCATFTTIPNGSIITIAHEAINDEFHVSDAHFPHSYWPVTSWALGGSVFAFIVLPVMEDFGIRRVFLGTYLIFVCFIIPQALAQNFATLIVSRFFSGGCVCILANTAAGVVGNLFEDSRARTIPLSLFLLAYLTGSSMGPVLGASIFQFLNWRWLSYMQLIWYSALFPLYYFAFHECRENVLLASRARAMRKQGKKAYTRFELHPVPISHKLRESSMRPLYMLVTEPVVFVCAAMTSLIFGLIYLFTQSVELVFVGTFGFSTVQAGYIQAAVVLGSCVGWFGILFSARLYFGSAKRNTEHPNTPIPEARLYMSCGAAFLGMAGGMFVYAWTSYPSLPWIAPAIGLAMVGAGNEIIAVGLCDYLVDAYSKYAGSAVAALAFGENITVAFLPLATQSMYTTLGYQWASSLLGFIALLLSFGPVILVIWGSKIRARSPFMKEASYEREKEAIAECVGEEGGYTGANSISGVV